MTAQIQTATNAASHEPATEAINAPAQDPPTINTLSDAVSFLLLQLFLFITLLPASVPHMHNNRGSPDA